MIWTTKVARNINPSSYFGCFLKSGVKLENVLCMYMGWSVCVCVFGVVSRMFFFNKMTSSSPAFEKKIVPYNFFF